jgi:hypothetical protein
MTYGEDIDQDAIVAVEVKRADAARNTGLGARHSDLANVATDELCKCAWRKGVVGSSDDRGDDSQKSEGGASKHDDTSVEDM